MGSANSWRKEKTLLSILCFFSIISFLLAHIETCLLPLGKLEIAFCFLPVSPFQAYCVTDSFSSLSIQARRAPKYTASILDLPSFRENFFRSLPPDLVYELPFRPLGLFPMVPYVRGCIILSLSLLLHYYWQNFSSRFRDGRPKRWVLSWKGVAVALHLANGQERNMESAFYVSQQVIR